MAHISARQTHLLAGGITVLLSGLALLIPATGEQVRLFIIVFGLLFHAYLIGTRFVASRHWVLSMIPGLMLVLAIQSILQTVGYYLGILLTERTDLITLIGTVIISQSIALLVRVPPEDQTEAEEQSNANLFSKKNLIGICFLLIAGATTSWSLHLAQRVGTTDSIRTPWPLLGDHMLWAIAAGWIVLLLSISLVRSRIFTALHAALAILPTIATIPLLYRIGYGFDGFLHVASEKILLASGTLNPKPLYYIGQYVFTTWLARLSHVSIADIDRWLVPVAAAILLPLAFLLALPRRQTATTSMLAVGLIPLGIFITTTPQSFAYLLGLSAILFAIGTAHRTHTLAALILLAWSIAVHPLAGIPLGVVAIAILAQQIKHRPLSRTIQIGSVILAGIIVPIMFIVIGMKGGTMMQWNLGTILSIEPWRERLMSFVPYIGNRFVLWPAWSTLIARTLPLILLILAMLSWRIERQLGTPRRALILLASAISMWVAGTILKTTGDFSFLIDYERGNYADRLHVLGVICLIPATLPALERLFLRATHAPIFTRILLVILFAGITTGLAYDAFPRHDALVTGRGWSTSRQDLEAVQIIERDANNEPYTVLANQSVSAAAVALLGFKRYADDVFFYPIPTGGPLYELYLRMTYNEPSRDTARDAGRLGDTDLVYVVVNKYWWRAEQVSESLRAIAQKDWDIESGTVRVYKFDLRAASSASTTTSGR